MTLNNVHSQSWETRKKLRCQVKSVNFCNKNLEETLGRIFTEGQVKKIKNGDKRQNWTQADIAQSITLYFTSAKAYKLLRKKKFPLYAIGPAETYMYMYNWVNHLIEGGSSKPTEKLMDAMVLTGSHLGWWDP